jgi:hypothetical protein
MKKGNRMHGSPFDDMWHSEGYLETDHPTQILEVLGSQKE